MEENSTEHNMPEKKEVLHSRQTSSCYYPHIFHVLKVHNLCNEGVMKNVTRMKLTSVVAVEKERMPQHRLTILKGQVS